jgi:predicted Abi (CAAX) family protease
LVKEGKSKEQRTVIIPEEIVRRNHQYIEGYLNRIASEEPQMTSIVESTKRNALEIEQNMMKWAKFDAEGNPLLEHIANLWIHVYAEKWGSLVHLVTIEKLNLKMAKAESSETKVQKNKELRQEVLNIFSEVQDIKDKLQKSIPDPDPRLVQ